MSFDPRSPSDCADLEPETALVCEWCDEVIDQVDIDVEAFEVMDGACCKSCFEDWGPK